MKIADKILKQFKTAGVVLVSFFFLSSCIPKSLFRPYVDKTKSENHFFSTFKDKVYYRTLATGGLSHIWEEIPADVNSFKVIDGLFSKDDKHVFRKVTVVNNVDVETFGAKTGYCFDKNHVYRTYRDYDDIRHDKVEVSLVVIEGANPKTYQIIDGNNRDWSKDDKHYFYKDTITDVDHDSFEFVNRNIGMDNKNIYYWYSSLTECPYRKGIDSVSIYNNGYFSIGNKMYYKGKQIIVTNIDLKSFELYNNAYLGLARDKNNFYLEGELIPNIDPNEIYLDSVENRIIYKGKQWNSSTKAFDRELEKD